MKGEFVIYTSKKGSDDIDRAVAIEICKMDVDFLKEKKV